MRYIKIFCSLNFKNKEIFYQHVLKKPYIILKIVINVVIIYTDIQNNDIITQDNITSQLYSRLSEAGEVGELLKHLIFTRIS